ncbi:glycoside hydrolase family 2 protein [Allostreptomyces psammosilenae]|uniref:beta-mannosidase n=1 Tax=Allostreptomyces psammosilenae TaxID=1892865 RepID=A0A853A8J0_9ACTN|nr:glycoside hydrolase family 2 TIM barrel-domain containing protein [Allostreptomyces psammosilenae]NYI06848.1 beta-mannosidase [Allostreptomyces psammosilenae]
MRTPLHDGWTVRAVAGEVPDSLSDIDVPATVPGCVHTDLLAAGLIPDPHLDRNEAALAWIGRTDWRYTTTFEWHPLVGLDRWELVCEGLDTVATVALNGVVIGRAENMHRTHRFGARAGLRRGRNELTVTFAAPVTHAERVRDALGPRPHINTHPYNFVRKMACNFGWDWGPDLATAGIWRPIWLEGWSTARLASVRPLVTVTERHGRTTGHVAVHVEVERGAATDDRPLRLTATIGDPGRSGGHGSSGGHGGHGEHGGAGRSGGPRHTAEVLLPAGSRTAVVDLEVPDPELWWPRGHGEQPLYPLHVRLAGVGAISLALDAWQGRIGFRTVRLDTSRDQHGTRAAFLVNGRPVLVRGANWIPDDCFPHRVDRDRYATRLRQAAEAGVNLLRVWGGGLYESDDFYELCDEAGMLTWQDFLFACAAYPEEEPLRGEVEAEAREAVTRLSPHPSLIVWNGNNESVSGHRDWGWREQLGDRTWGHGYYFDLLPRIVAELDPTRPYIPTSPWSFDEGIHPNDPDHGLSHIWDVWNQVDYTAYRDHVPGLAAEFGFQGPPNWATLTRAVHDQPLTPESPGVLAHNKADDGPAKLARGLAPHFPPPQGVDDWHWATQLNQARAVALGVEHFRSHAPRCSGTIMWQLNDCWPVTSWAAIDGDGRRKPLWYALRRSHAERLLTIQPRGESLALVAVNDTAEPWSERVEVVRLGFDGGPLAKAEVEVHAAPRTAAATPLPPALATPDRPEAELLVAEARADETRADETRADETRGGEAGGAGVAGASARDGGRPRALWFFLPDRDQALPRADLTTTVRPDGDQVRITVTARALLRDLALLADRVLPAAEVDTMLLTLLPGESATFTVRGPGVGAVPAERWADPLVLRSANQLVTP